MKYMDYLDYLGTTAPYDKFYGVLDFIVLVDPNNEEEVRDAIETLECYSSREYCRNTVRYAEFIAKYGNSELFISIMKGVTWLPCSIREAVQACQNFVDGRIERLPHNVAESVAYIVNMVVTEYAHSIALVYRTKFED